MLCAKLRCARSTKRIILLSSSVLVISAAYILFSLCMTSKISLHNMVIPENDALSFSNVESGLRSVKSWHSQDLETPSRQACVHSKLEVWHSALKEHFKDVEPLQCSKNEENWVYTKNGTVRISQRAKKDHGKILCQYIPLLRGADDFEVYYGDPIKPVRDGMKLTSDFFDVRCVGQDGGIYTNLHSGICPINDTYTSTGSKHASGKQHHYNILMFGFDSVSRMTWLRNLPKSYEYFTKVLGGTILEGYNIVGDGTPQALFPILTGKKEEELPEVRRGYDNATTVDNHPWIWKELKKLGYVTQWGEDGASIGTFTYRMLGFKDQPVDHYLRTFYLKAEHRYARQQPYCLGSVPRHLNMLSWIKELFEVYPNRPKFSFLFHSEYSHDLYNELKWADEDLKEFLETMHNDGHLDRTVLILMADHGARFIALRQTVQGKYEERMPFFGFRFPPAFKEQHPEAMKNLQINAHRLTSPFDIHATFHDIINFTGAGRGRVSERGISLFKEIPQERTCAHAGIAPHWCACMNWVSVNPSDALVHRAAQALVKTINEITEYKRGECVQLDISNISSAVRFTPNDNMLKFKQSMDGDGRTADFSDDMEVTEILYQVTITATPSWAKFEATVKYFPLEDRFEANSAEISRINRYRMQPHCVMKSLPHLRPYCYCKEQLN